MFHETDVEERISHSTSSSWSSEDEGFPHVVYHPAFPSRHNGSDDNGTTSECLSASSFDCYSLSDTGCFICVHREDHKSDDSCSTASLLEFLQTIEDEDSFTDLSSDDEDDDDTLTTVSDMSDFGSMSFLGSDDEDI